MKDFPLYRSPRAALVGTLLLAVPPIVLSQSQLGVLYAVMLILFLLPAGCCIAGLVCGLLPMAAGVLAGMLGMYFLGGTRGLLLAAAYLLPVVGGFALLVSRRVPFKESCPILIGVHAAALAACFLLLQGWAGGDLYAYAAAQTVAFFEKWELGDTLLYQMYSMGVLDLPESLRQNLLTPVLGGYIMSAAARSDLLLSLSAFIRQTAAALVPNVIVSQSILGGVLCLLLPLRFGFIAEERRAFRSSRDKDAEEAETGKTGNGVDFPDLQMPKFETWHMPRGMGWKVGLALVAGYFLRGDTGSAAHVAGSILYAAGHTLFIIQGAALLNFVQKKRGTRRVWRVILPILLMFLSVLPFLGIFDQISNIRRLRRPPETKEEL